MITRYEAKITRLCLQLRRCCHRPVWSCVRTATVGVGGGRRMHRAQMLLVPVKAVGLASEARPPSVHSAIHSRVHG
jgi:hypothetical protein